MFRKSASFKNFFLRSKFSAWNKYLTSAGHRVRHSPLRAGHLQFVPVKNCQEDLMRMWSKFRQKAYRAIFYKPQRYIYLQRGHFFIELKDFFQMKKLLKHWKKLRVQRKKNKWFQFNTVRNLPSNIHICKPVSSDTFILNKARGVLYFA